MAGSDPALRAEILDTMDCRSSRTVRGATLRDLRDRLAPDATVTQFTKALGSLAYNKDTGLPIQWTRVTSHERPYADGIRDHVVTLRR